MNYLFSMLVSILIFTGCSFIPRITFDKANTVPEKVEKSQKIVRCKGDIILDDLGRVSSCTKGFYSNEKSYNKSERKITFKEKILNFFANLKGYFFWIVLGLFFFAPSILSFLVGRFIEGTFGIAKKALQSTVRAIKNAKGNGGKYLEELKEEHNKDLNVKKLINQLRAEIDIDKKEK